MKAKEYLLQIPKLHTKIQNKKERIARLDSILKSPGVPELTSDRVQTSLTLDKMERMIAEKAQLEEEVQSLMYKEAALIIKIGKQIDEMESPLQARLLHLRYEEGLRWEKVAAIMNYSENYIKGKCHGKALQEFEKIIRNILT